MLTQLTRREQRGDKAIQRSLVYDSTNASPLTKRSDESRLISLLYLTKIATIFQFPWPFLEIFWKPYADLTCPQQNREGGGDIKASDPQLYLRFLSVLDKATTLNSLPSAFDKERK